MSAPEDPPRWGSATSGLPEQLLLGLEEARGVAPAPEQMARMRSGLAPILALGAAATLGGGAAGLATADAAAKASGAALGQAGVTLGQAGAASGASSLGLGVVGAKLIPLILVLGGVAGAVWVATLPPESLTGNDKSGLPPPHGAASLSTPRANAPPPDVPLAKSHTAQLQAPSPTIPSPSQAHSQKAASAHENREKAAPLTENSAFLSEARLLGRARGLLAATPAEALRLCRQHQEEFSNGVLAQEREVIATEALVRLGRLSEARERVARFRKRFSGSPHLPKLEALVSTQQPVTQ